MTVTAAHKLYMLDELKGRHGTGEPLGIGSFVKWLREHGYTHRSQHFHTGLIYAILTRETYAGRHYYGRNSRTNEARPREG